MRALLIIFVLSALACPALLAQRQDAKARDITSRSEYRGYRVENPPGYEGEEGDGGEDEGRSSDGDSAARRGAGADGPQQSPGAGPSGRGGGQGLNFPSWIGSLFQVIAWVVIIAGAAIALFFIVKALFGIKWKRKRKSTKSKAKKKSPEAEGETESAEEEPVDEKVFEDALEIAMRDYKEAIAREDWGAATLLAYRIFWLRAGWKGCVEPSDTHTWRDALRMVRQTETRRDVRELLPLVERVRYADHSPDKLQFNDWSLKLERISPQGVL